MADLKLYDKVPNEIALMMWNKALRANGVHHFRLSPGSLTTNGQLLDVEPWDNNTREAVSTWRHRYVISHIDKLSRAEHDKWVTNMRQEGSLWVAPLRRGTRMRKQHRNADYVERVKVNGRQDLVAVTFAKYPVNIDLLDEFANRDRFRGLQRIALNYKQTENGSSWGILPFNCSCLRTSHEKLTYCPAKIAQFLRLFPDVTDFYFIIRIAAKNLVVPRSIMQGGLAAKKAATAKLSAIAHGRITKKPPKIPYTAQQMIDATIRHVRRTAEREDLEIWSDSGRTFYEIRGTDARDRLRNYADMSQVMKGLKKAWNDEAKKPFISTRDKTKMRATQFHFLVCPHRLNRK